MTFEKSKIYEEALQKYLNQKYDTLVNPVNVITYQDNVLLFYFDVNEAYNELKIIYITQKETDEMLFPKFL